MNGIVGIQEIEEVEKVENNGYKLFFRVCLCRERTYKTLLKVVSGSRNSFLRLGKNGT